MIDRSMIERAVLEDNPAARAAFLKKHKASVRRSIDALAKFYGVFQVAFPQWPHGERKQHVGLFLHAAGNCVTTALNLLVSGYPLPAGHLLRQHVEAVAMAMLCATPATGVLEQVIGKKHTYPAHKAVDRVLQKGPRRQLESALGLSASGWQSFAHMAEFYSAYSHSGVFAASYHVKFGRKAGGPILGAEFDPQKWTAQRNDLASIRLASETLGPLAKALDRAMLALEGASADLSESMPRRKVTSSAS